MIEIRTEWVATTQTSQWQKNDQSTISPALNGNWDVEVHLDKPLQTIDGFGACFNELGWDSLSALNETDREAILEELFAPGVGANFNSCRMPIGANDFSVIGIRTTRCRATLPWSTSVSRGTSNC